jgi:hypothetical protein
MVALLVFSAWFCRRRKKRNKGKDNEQNGQAGPDNVKSWIRNTDSTPPTVPPSTTTTNSVAKTEHHPLVSQVTPTPEYRPSTPPARSPPPNYTSPTSSKRDNVRVQTWVPTRPERPESSLHNTTLGFMRARFDKESTIGPADSASNAPPPLSAGRTPRSILNEPYRPRTTSPFRYEHDDDETELNHLRGVRDPDRRRTFSTMDSRLFDQRYNKAAEADDDDRTITPEPLRITKHKRNFSEPNPPTPSEYQASYPAADIIDEYAEDRINMEPSVWSSSVQTSVWSDGRIQSDREKTRERLEGERAPPPSSLLEAPLPTQGSSIYTFDMYGNPNPPQNMPQVTDEMVARIDDHLEEHRRGSGEVDWKKLGGKI